MTAAGAPTGAADHPTRRFRMRMDGFGRRGAPASRQQRAACRHGDLSRPKGRTRRRGGRWVWVPALLLGATLPAVPAGVDKVELVSVSSAGVQGDKDSGNGALSADGRFVVFYSDATNLVPGDTNAQGDLFVR